MKRFIAICALCLFLASGVLADEISLKNGNKLAGSIVSIDETGLKIETAYGTLDIPRADIQSACLGDPSIPATTSGYDKNKKKRIVGKWKRGDGYLWFYASGFVKASYDNNKNRSWRYTGDNKYAYIGPEGETQEILLLKNGTVLHFSNGQEWHKVN